MSDLRPSLDTPEVAAAEEVVATETGTALRSQRRSPLGMAVRRFRRNKIAVVGTVFLLIILLLALFAPLIAQQSPTAVDLGAIRRPPSGEHWLGTDASGRDVFARLIYAARVSLLVGVFAALLAVLLGTIVGAVAGLFGGWADSVLMRAADLVLSFPPIVVIIVLAGILGPSLPILIIAIAATAWPTTARLVRGVTLAVREREYLHAARVAGASRGWLLRKHIVPAAMGQIVVVGTIEVAHAILSEAVLSFLGLGVQPPQASWGNMLNDAQSLTVIQSMPWLWLPPGLAIAMTVLAVNFVGDGLRDAVDPRQSGEVLMTDTTEPLLVIDDLVVEFRTDEGVVKAVDGAAFTVDKGEIVGVVGESGSGKSVTAMSILGLVKSGRRVRGAIRFRGRDLATLPAKELRSIRGAEIAMIFQDPMTALNPVVTIGRQIVEALRLHDKKLSKSAARDRAVELLALVGMPDAAARFKQYPHEFSGGMRQRAMIAMAIANGPSLLIADEPTTALDVTIQAQVLDLLKVAQQETQAATLLITHDLGVVAELADRVVVMYAGRVVEQGDVVTVFTAPRHPYTVGLLESLPRLDRDVDELHPIPGSPPSLLDPPPGCPFHPRCPLARDRCRTERPELRVVGNGTAIHRTACHFAEELTALPTEVTR